MTMKFYTPKELGAALEKKDPKRTERIRKDLAFRVAQMLIEARVQKGVTQTGLAKMAGTKQSVIARAENGSHLVSLGFLKMLADAYGTYVEPPRFGFMVVNRALSIGSNSDKSESSKRESFTINEETLVDHYEHEFSSATETESALPAMAAN